MMTSDAQSKTAKKEPVGWEWIPYWIGRLLAIVIIVATFALILLAIVAFAALVIWGVSWAGARLV